MSKISRTISIAKDSETQWRVGRGVGDVSSYKVEKGVLKERSVDQRDECDIEGAGLTK